ncbi:ImmA/IrrE family metallo-endopeptidase [Bradyrhizobium sp. SRS-191]|uniref:ImmA/IrrE family metallo-endopeptidase n=1 Tax=Bradyrhizobium sp. SRS-191 TaxID=2962606 RepID=UPI00211E2EE8|nr:ImmA/IrrE family metallo-endopeptidase [Bradyrhizobium sp. SRS-191]
MSDIYYQAPARSGDNIESLADAVRQAFNLTHQDFFPVVPFVELGLQHMQPGIEFDIVEGDLLGARMGAVNPLTGAFMIREDVYEGAVRHEPRHRFTVAHEAGHALMHVGTLNRVPIPGAKILTYCDPEWQANRFAGALLMPRHLVWHARTIDEITTRFGVSREAAKARIKTLKIGISI